MLSYNHALIKILRMEQHTLVSTPIFLALRKLSQEDSKLKDSLECRAFQGSLGYIKLLEEEAHITSLFC